MEPFDVRELLQLQSVPGVGPLKLRSLITHFQTPDRVLSATPRELHRVPGIDKHLAVTIARHRVPDETITHQLRAVNAVGGEIISLWDERYPALLKRIYDPPTLLYTLGHPRRGDECLLAVVGTRRPSTYGEKVVRTIVRELVEAGYGIVSGLARGIDTLAHMETLSAGGRTIGVLGSGIDKPYPRENVSLMKRMLAEGAVMSEFPMGTKPDAPNFPRRNRIVSGMSVGTIVVESDVDGGAMITAATALDQNREVFAIPGPIFEPRSIGPHTLVRDGRAKIVMSAEEILSELPGGRVLRTRKELRGELPELTLFERKVLDTLNEHPLHVDAIADRAAIGSADTLVALLGLEIKKLVRQLPGKHFVVW